MQMVWTNRKKRSSKDNFHSRNMNEEQLVRLLSGKEFSDVKSCCKEEWSDFVLLVKSEDLNCINVIT